ncbi:MAG TPA: hypothetical protein VIM11_19115 [Tepidisphaeraceae bacterium]|jgi:hypothetical protein
MSNCPFCNLDPGPNGAGPDLPGPKHDVGKRATGFLGRAWLSIQWLFPATLLVLMPKCPICVAAYVALFTGIGITVSTGRWIQILMVVFCLSSLGYFSVKHWRSRSRARGSHHSDFHLV